MVGVTHLESAQFKPISEFKLKFHLGIADIGFKINQDEQIGLIVEPIGVL